MHTLILESMVPIKGTNAMPSCDNTPAVHWIRKLNCSSLVVANELLKILGSRMAQAHFPPPQIHHLSLIHI